MNKSVRGLALFLSVLLLCLLALPGSLAAASSQSLTGVWEGNYIGIINYSSIQRKIRLDIDYCESGIVEGVATIDNGDNGRYTFSGTYDAGTGNLTFYGDEWIDNPSNFGFARFNGSVNLSKGVYSGTIDSDSSRTFSLKKKSDTPSAIRLDKNSIPRRWVGEYDGHSGDVVVRRSYEMEIVTINDDGTIEGEAFFTPSPKADSALGETGSYKFSGKISVRSGKITMQGHTWIQHPQSSNFTFVSLSGQITFSNGWSLSGSSEKGIWSMTAATEKSVTRRDEYSIQVLDEAGKPLKGASVTYDGETKATDTDGIARFDAYSYRNPVITVSKSGYLSWTNKGTNWEKDKNRFETVILYSEASGDLRLMEALYSNYKDLSKSTNLLTGTKKVSIGNDIAWAWDLDFGNFYVSCKAMEPSQVDRYEFWQGAKCIAKANNGFFSLNTDSFSKGSDCFIRVVAKDGKMVDTRINLILTEAKKNDEGSISLNGKSLSFNVPDDIPFVGGGKFELSFPINVPVTWRASENKIQVGLNLNVAGGKSEDEQWDSCKETIDQLKRTFGGNGKNGLLVGKQNIGQRNKYQSLIKKTNQWKFFKNGEVNFLGYLEADMGSNIATGCLMLQFKIDAASFDFNTWVVVVPVTVQIKLGLEASLVGTVSYNFDTSTLDGDIALKPSATLTAFGGIGVSKLVGVGAYGSAKLAGDIELIPELYLDSVTLTGELGVKAYLAWLTYEKPFAYNTWYLYTGNRTRGIDEEAQVLDDLLNQHLLGDMFDASQYKVASLDYLEDEKDMMDSSITEETRRKARNTDLRTEFSSLIQNTYRNAQPVMVSSGDALYAAFLRGNSSSGNVYIAVSRYDGKNWQTGVAVNSSNIMDSAPNLVVDSNGRIWLTYARTTAKTDDLMLSYAKNQEIVVGEINPDTLAFTEAAAYSGNSYAHMPQLSLVGGCPTLVYVDSEVTDDDSVLWPEKNTVYSASYDGTSWTGANAEYTIDKVVSSVTVGEEDGGLSIACVVDEDNDYKTSTDRTIYTGKKGTLQNLEATVGGKIIYAVFPGGSSPVYIWNEENALCTSAGDKLALPGITGEFTVSGNAVYYSAATENGAELYVIRFENGLWSDPVLLTEGSGYFENLNVASLEGQDYVFGMYANVTIGETEVTDKKDLVWTKVQAASDLVITNCEYDSSAITAGEEAEIQVTVHNSGDRDAQNINIYVDDELAITKAEKVQVGKDITATIKVTCPDTPTEFRIKVNETDVTDYHPDDNEWVLTMGYPDLAVSLESYQIGTKTTVTAHVLNRGVSPASCVISLLGPDGESLWEDVFRSIEPSATATTSYVVDWDAAGVDELDITAVLTLQSEDLYEYNNKDTVHVAYVGSRKLKADFVMPTFMTIVEEEAFAGSAFKAVRLPDSTISIGSRAFADCSNLVQIEIPATVTSIADDAFTGTGDLVIYCPAGSYAAQYATEHNITYVAE